MDLFDDLFGNDKKKRAEAFGLFSFLNAMEEEELEEQRKLEQESEDQDLEDDDEED